MKPYEQRFPWTLDWNLLRTFMVVVDQQGITRAAELLGLTQPTISSALKRLEETVGKRLIDRKPNLFAVTPEGEILYRECQAMFGAVSQIPGLVNAVKAQVTGHIAIVVASHVISSQFEDLLHSFNSRHPDVTYSISVAESSEVMNRLRQNQASFGMCLMREPDPALWSAPLFREFFGLYCGPHHRLFNQDTIQLAELRGENSVSFQTDIESGPLYAVTQLRERALLKPGLKGVSANLPEVRRMIMAGIGIGALPVHVANRDVALGNLRQLPPYDDLPPIDVHFAYNPKRSLNPAETALIGEVKSFLEDTPLEDRTYR
ncbi:LysR family transcriptional regulator [Leisingera sp. ANG-M1]|uniref:LysR family transcriptional regulator n=1 Tax=Leisingera sp. ANG-M1 TaxID=1577895 RepID=UPI00057E27C4|nr:LysR family transcriptional regulator [Leisingera sp. ANG-M1]KIC08884.1 LysR family transcriptional regulator [Leisingera sp. ANG-M1]